MKEEIKIAFINISNACFEYRGTKQEHIALDKYLEIIKRELEKVCTCVREEELADLIKKDKD